MRVKEISICHIYEKDKKLRKEDVINLMKWVEQQPHLPKINELETVLFLHSCHYNNEIAKITIDTYFTVKTLCPDMFGTRNPRDQQVKTSIDTFLCVPLSKLGGDGEVLVFARLMDTNPDNYSFTMAARCFDMITLLHMHQNGPPNGVVVVLDMKGMTFAHFLKMGVVAVKKFLHYLQEGMPIRLKGIHYCNIVPFMDKVMAMLKPFLKEQTLDMIFLHSGMDTLYDHFPKDIFPQDYGGSTESLEVLHEKYKSLMNDNEEFFRNQELQIVDESKRPGKPVNFSDVFGMEGTFKRLELD